MHYVKTTGRETFIDGVMVFYKGVNVALVYYLVFLQFITQGEDQLCLFHSTLINGMLASCGSIILRLCTRSKKACDGGCATFVAQSRIWSWQQKGFMNAKAYVLTDSLFYFYSNGKLKCKQQMPGV